ncbi:MAG: DNA gyrase inhibitor YacG [Phycisphaerae bacterium]|nr:DNA gyrase inhibitor YacG [Phycisphaerae bacterium]
MEDRDQTSLNKPAEYLRFTCPTCKRRVSAQKEAPLTLPEFFPFCSERCKMIDLGAWLDAEYRIPSKPDDQSDLPTERDASADGEDSPR